jgi:hypothetical protein
MGLGEPPLAGPAALEGLLEAGQAGDFFRRG